MAAAITVAAATYGNIRPSIANILLCLLFIVFCIVLFVSHVSETKMLNFYLIAIDRLWLLKAIQGTNNNNYHSIYAISLDSFPGDKHPQDNAASTTLRWSVRQS